MLQLQMKFQNKMRSRGTFSKVEQNSASASLGKVNIKAFPKIIYFNRNIGSIAVLLLNSRQCFGGATLILPSSKIWSGSDVTLRSCTKLEINKENFFTSELSMGPTFEAQNST